MRMQFMAIRPAIHTIGTGLVVLGLNGCGGLESVATYEPITDPAQLYMRLALDHPAVTLSTAAPYNTLQLTATPQDASGTPMAGLPAPTFRSSDTTAVYVAADGLLTARQATTGVSVIAELTAGGVRHADTAMVNVTAETSPPTLASVVLKPGPADSATWAMIDVGNAVAVYPLLITGQLSCCNFTAANGLDAAGNPIPDLAFEYTSLDPSILTVDRWRGALFTASQPGVARVVARTTAYGVSAADTLLITLTLPIGNQVEVQPGSGGQVLVEPTEIQIAPYGVVAWRSRVMASVDLTFDDPTNVGQPSDGVCGAIDLLISFHFLRLGPGPYCGAGNVALAAAAADTLPVAQIRMFPIPGVYPYHTPSGAVGRVIVKTGIE